MGMGLVACRGKYKHGETQDTNRYHWKESIIQVTSHREQEEG